MPLQIHTLKDRPDLQSLVFSDAFGPPFWPEYMQHNPTSDFYYSPHCLKHYLDFAFAGVIYGQVVARAFSVPFAFGDEDRRELPDGGWDQVIRWAHEDRLLGRQSTAVSALEICVLPHVRGGGHAFHLLAEMNANARRLGFSDLYAPVRPTEKSLHPRISMSEYLKLERSPGVPQDPWLRLHIRAGGRIIKVAPYSATIVGTIHEWKQWTELEFNNEGSTVVAGALAPVQISLRDDIGVYVEPAVWIHHQL